MDFSLTRNRLIDNLRSKIADQRVLDAMQRIPRECFVPAKYEAMAYRNEPLPIGYKQTISQPLIIAIMTQALELSGDEKVLEIGTGSGYQTAVLAELAREVITTERILYLAESAKKALNSLFFTNIKIHMATGRLGWEPDAPYAGILVTAGAPRIPDMLLEQLAIGGRLVVPVGSHDIQELYQITRTASENIVKRLGACRFVPLIGDDAWKEE
jgi:protein-L-isoaspartate(D-aspartate) O-methyltransferase